MEFVTHEIFTITDKIEVDPALINCCKLLFKWSNEMGLQGYKVKNLRFVDSEKLNPTNIYKKWICELEVKEY